MADNSELSY